MSYKVTITKPALKQLENLTSQINSQIADAIDGLKTDPRPSGCKKLKGNTESIWRIRVKDYRVLYAIEDSIRIVEIRRIGHRRDIYK